MAHRVHGHLHTVVGVAERKLSERHRFLGLDLATCIVRNGMAWRWGVASFDNASYVRRDSWRISSRYHRHGRDERFVSVLARISISVFWVQLIQTHDEVFVDPESSGELLRVCHKLEGTIKKHTHVAPSRIYCLLASHINTQPTARQASGSLGALTETSKFASHTARMRPRYKVALSLAIQFFFLGRIG